MQLLIDKGLDNKISVQTSVFISESRTARDTNSHFKIPNAFKSNSLEKKKVHDLFSTCSLKATGDESRAVPRARMSHNDYWLLSLNFSFRITLLKSPFNHSNVGEIICRDHCANNIAKSMTYLTRTVLTFASVDEILCCNHLNKTSSAVLSHGTIYSVWSSNLWLCGWDPMVLPFQ